MKTYKTLKAEIAKLEQQAEALRKKEKAVITQVKKIIAEHGLTAADLGLGGSSTKPTGRRKVTVKPASRTASPAGIAKYRDPKTQKTWTGRGKPPAWIAGVKNRDAYLIAEPAASAPEAKNVTKAKKAKPVRKSGGAIKLDKAANSVPAKKKAAAKKKRRQTSIKTPAVQIESGPAS